MSKKVERVKIVTPKGIAKWPKVVTPDTKFNPDGIYSIELVLPEGECTNLCKMLDEIVDKHYEDTKAELKPAKAKELQKHPAYQLEYEDESGEETGNVIFKFVKNAIITKKNGERVEVKPKLFDAGGFVITTLLNMGNGSEVRVSGQASPWYVPATGKCGCKLYLDAVQVLKLVEYGGGGNSESYGFGVEEGFAVDNESTATEFNEDDF